MLTKQSILQQSDLILGTLIKSNEDTELFTWDAALEGKALTNQKNNDHLTMDLWEWPQGVALYGIFKLYIETKNKKYLDYLVKWFDEKIEKGLPDKNINTMAPLLTLAHLYEIIPNEKYLQICTEWATWVMEEMPRTEEGGLQHVTTHTLNEEEIWDDTLFMTVLFIAKMGVITEDEKYKQEAIHQFLLHIKYLADPNTGLWFHGFCFKGRHRFGEIFWARGNSWFTAGAVEFIEMIELPEDVRAHVVKNLVAQINKLLEIQAEEGMWHTVLDDESSYVETSGSAAIAFGMLKAMRQGYILDNQKEKIMKAVEAIINQVAEDGIVGQVSYGTAMGMDKEHYKNIPLCPTAYGQALVLLMLAELYKHLD